MGAPDIKPGYKAEATAALSADAPPETKLQNGANARRDDSTTLTDHNDDTNAPPGDGQLDTPAEAAIMAIGDSDLWRQLELEKERYPGASTWAPGEARLFELLFFRQDLPILPAHWELDLRGVPISEANFAEGEIMPLVYAHKKDFLATTALVNLIELTAAIRTASESGLHTRVPELIKEGMDKFLAWAAEDGGYSHLRVVPNIITEIVDTTMEEIDITDLMQSRMRALGRLQREFLREGRDDDFWDGTGPADTKAALYEDEDDHGLTRNDLLLQKYLSPRKAHAHKHKRGAGGKRRRRRSNNSMEDELAVQATPDSANGTRPTKRRTFASPSTEVDELATPDVSGISTPPSERKEAKHVFSSPASAATTGHSSPRSATEDVKYRRPLPVVYGLFVLNTSVFVLTADSSRGDTGYVSFHVETDFMERRQSLWNALTLAMVACLARDELRLRADDFEPLGTGGDESDPDA